MSEFPCRDGTHNQDKLFLGRRFVFDLKLASRIVCVVCCVVQAVTACAAKGSEKALLKTCDEIRDALLQQLSVSFTKDWDQEREERKEEFASELSIVPQKHCLLNSKLV